MSNIVNAIFDGSRRKAITCPLFQYDYGQILKISGVELPESYQVQFSNTEDAGVSKTMLGDADGVQIPDEYLLTGDYIYAFIFLHEGETDGETEYVIEIPVIRRPVPSEETPTPAEQSLIDQLLAQLNQGVEAAETAADEAGQAAETAVAGMIDDTLTIQGKAADAKATGDEISQLKADLNTKVSAAALDYGYLKSYNVASLWEQGNINSTTGANSPSTTDLHTYTIRTKEYLDSNATNVIVKNASQNYRISVYKYDSSNAFVGYTNKQTALEIDSQYKYRLVLLHYSSASLGNYITVSPSEYNEVGIFSDLSTVVTDDELQPIIEKVDNSINKNTYKYGYANDSNNINLWEQGNINGSTGANSPSTATLHAYTIRTKGYIDSSVEKVLCSQGYFSVYTYSIDGTFESNSPYAQEYSGFSSDKKYRINYRTQPTTGGVAEITPEYANNIYFLSSSLVNSPYLKTVSWAKNVPNNWYQGLGSDYSLFEHTTSYDDFISAFTALCSNRNDVTITNIGTSSDDKDMFSYEIVPTLYKGMTSFNRNNKPVKVVIVSGQHGFEKSSCYGLYYFVRDLLNSYLDDPVLTWIKSNVHLIIIPCANPYGFTNMVRKNANGVDLNRNWNPGFDGTISPSSEYYGGASAFDQPETQAIKAVIDANTDAFYLIDFHTNGEYTVANWNIVNWNSFNVSVTTDDYFVNAYRAAYIHVSQLTECFASEYNLDSDGSAMGSITQNTQLSTISTYSRSLGIMSNTFEGMNGFPSDAEPYQPNEQKANSEMICNWIKTLLSIFSNVDI